MTTRSKSVAETAEWPAARPQAVALVSPRAVAWAVRRLENALSALDLDPRMGGRARGVVRPLERAD